MPRSILLSQVRQEIDHLSRHRLVCAVYGISTEWVEWNQTAVMGGWISVTRHHHPAGPKVIDVWEFSQIMASAVVDSYGVNMMPYLAEDAARDAAREAAIAKAVLSDASLSPDGASYQSFAGK